jgi:hypothetical protein
MRCLATLPLRGKNKALSGAGCPSEISSVGGSKTGAIRALVAAKSAASASKVNKRRNGREGPIFCEKEKGYAQKRV